MGSVCISKSLMCVCVSFSGIDFGVEHIPFVRMVNFQFLAQWITLPTQLFLVLYSFGASLLQSLIIWLIDSSLSPHNLHLLFCSILSILALIWLVFIALFCAAMNRDSVSLLRFPLFSQVHVFLCEMSLVSHLKHPYSCFSSHFSFLVILVLLILVSSVLFPLAVISLPSYRTILSLRRHYLNFGFSFSLWQSFIDLSPRLWVRDDSDYMYSPYLCFCRPFWVMFFCHIYSTLTGRWAVPKSAIFKFPCRLGLLGILLIYTSVPFLIISRVLSISGAMVILRYHIFSISIYMSLYLFILLYSVTGTL